jgi:hypothetical protein
LNSRPSWASSAKIGRKDAVMISSEKNSEGPTSTAASIRTSRRGLAPPSRSMCLCAFSTITMPASIMVPMAIAMPPSDMMLALMPWWNMTMNDSRMPSGSSRIATRALRRCIKKTKQMSATIPPCCSSLLRRFSTARSISGPRS